VAEDRVRGSHSGAHCNCLNTISNHRLCRGNLPS